MALNSSGPISLGGATTGQSINLELGQSATANTSLNASNVRTLAGVASGAITMPTNFYGKSNSIPFGCATYTAAGTYTFTVPAGASKISVVCIGAGGSGASFDGTRRLTNYGLGSGAALSYTNCISVTPGESLTVTVGQPAISVQSTYLRGGSSSVSRGATALILAQGGKTGYLCGCSPGLASCSIGAVKYSGKAAPGNYTSDGVASVAGSNIPIAGSGGAGGGTGYLCATFAPCCVFFDLNNSSGGVGLFGTGSTATTATGGGSGGTNGSVHNISGVGGNYGGAGTGSSDGDDTSDVYAALGGVGGVRIIYGGTGKSYPNNAT
jgi:hypothetical protein